MDNVRTSSVTNTIPAVPPPHRRSRPPAALRICHPFTLSRVRTPSQASKPKHPVLQRGTTPPAQPRSSATSNTWWCDAMEAVIHRSLDPAPLHPSVDPQHVLAGNFAPVQELPPTPCPVVKGAIPRCLRGGAYVRNGPNPSHPPRGPYHLFDGDGMLHSLLLPVEDGGHATFCSRYVRTQRYEVERRSGAPVVPNFFALRGPSGAALGAVMVARVLAGQMDVMGGFSPANISLSFFHDRLLALGDFDQPFALHLSPEDGDLSTLSRWDFGGELRGGMGPHPWTDPATGEVFALSSSLVPPFLSYIRFDGEGNKQPDVHICTGPIPGVFHGFAVTARFAFIPDLQMVLDPMAMALSGGSLFRIDPKKVPRVGVLPRYAESGKELKWVDTPGFNPLHIVNAWDEGDDVVVMVVSNTLNMEHLVDRMELVHGQMEMVRIELGAKPTVSRTPLSVMSLDLGTINPAYRGRQNRYCYMAVAGDAPKIRGVAKLDLELAKMKKDCTVAYREYGQGCFGGETFFVAEGDGAGGGDEDHGYLVTYLHDEEKGNSRFLVMDARSPELETVAEVALPSRVPYGFHGIFVSHDELRRQRPR